MLSPFGRPRRPGSGSSRFYPPVCYQLSQAGTSSLLRVLLRPPPLRSASGLPLRLPFPFFPGTIRVLPQLPRTPCELPHPQPRVRADQVSGFALCCTLTLLPRRIRFTCAMCSSLPIASFRPCRYRQRPCDSDCLPPGRGDACFFQQAGFARFAGQTKKGSRRNDGFLFSASKTEPVSCRRFRSAASGRGR